MDTLPITNGVRTILPAPEGYVVNFGDPQQINALPSYVSFGIEAPLATLALIQRFYTKIYLLGGLTVDDGFMLLAWLSSMITQALNVNSFVAKVYGVHGWEMPVEKFQFFTLTNYLTSTIYMLCNGFTKLSLLTFYLQLSPFPKFRVPVWISIGLVSCYTIIITSLLLFTCNPVWMAWSALPDESKCLSRGPLYIATGVSNIVTDVIIFLLPIPMVMSLQMTVEKKLAAVLVFGLGTATVIVSCLRLAYVFRLLQSVDPSWDYASIGYALHLEANLFIICGCIPTLKKFIQRFIPGPLDSGMRHDTGESRSNQRSTYQQQKEESVEMDKFTGHQKTKTYPVMQETVDIWAESEHGDDHSDRAILQTKDFTLRYDRDVDDVGLINSPATDRRNHSD